MICYWDVGTDLYLKFWLHSNILVFIIGFEQPAFTVMEAARQYLLGVEVQQESDQIAEELTVVLLISTIDGSAVGTTFVLL